MRTWYYNFLFGVWLLGSWPCMGGVTSKIYEIGSAEKRLLIGEMRYFIEPVSVPLDINKIIQKDTWVTTNTRRLFTWNEIKDQRVVISFDIETEQETLYFNYMWAPPLNTQKFIILDGHGNLIEPEVLRNRMVLARAKLMKGQYRVFFIAEPALLSHVKSNIFVMNTAFMSGQYLHESKFYMFVYGTGAAFVFFNFTMFLLHRKKYFIYYVGYSCTILYLLAAGSGDLFQGSAIFWNVALSTNCLFTVLMSSSVLRLREYHPLLRRSALALWLISAILMLFPYLEYSEQLNFIGLSIGLFVYFLCMYAAVRRMITGYIPATFFALGWGILGVGYGLNMLAIYFVSMPGLIYSAYIAYAIESMLFAVALAYRTRDSEQKAIEDKRHALSQLQKVVYPHQMEQIRLGASLENTMPTSPGHGCVLSLDIIGSSKIKHIRSKDFLRNVFSRCNAIMAEGYDGKNLKANAYRVKEMGDGFLCSIGYPFQSLTNNPTNDAIELARRFAEVLHEEAAMLHLETPISCGIGIALDNVTGFYPETGTKEYDIFGPAIILATRYEAMRKTLFEAEAGRSVLIIQEVVYQSLDPSYRKGFTMLNLKEINIVVRDDPGATRLYYQFLDQKLMGEDPLPLESKVG